MRRPYRFGGIEIDKQDRLMIRLRSLSQSRHSFSRNSPPHPAASDDADPQRDSQAGIRPATSVSPPFDFRLSVSGTQANVVPPDSDVFFEVLVSLQSVLVPEQFEVLEREPITPSRAGGLTGNRQRRL
jgi:hypothetical protein